jgi:replicative DNA helicase
MSRPDLKALPGGKDTPAAFLGYDRDAEAALISNAIYDPSSFDEVGSLVTPEVFSSEAHRRIWEAMVTLRLRGDAIDVVSVASELRATDRLDQVGGMPYLTEVLNAAPVMLTRHLIERARLVRDLWVRRLTVEAGALIRARATGDTTPIDELIGAARSAIDALSDKLAASEDTAHVKEVLVRTVKNIQAASGNNGLGELPSGFDRLDRMTGGLQRELMIVAGRPGMAKTSMAMGIADHVAAAGHGVFVASLETIDDQLMMRQACAEGRVDVLRARTGMLNPTDWSRLTSAIAKMADWPMYIDDISGMSVLELWTRCRRVQATLRRAGKDLRLVVADYIQLLKAPRQRMEREEIVSENVRTLKAMASDLGVCVMGVAQLNRETEKRADHRPMLSDLRESGEIEQCARTVLMLFRQDYYKRDTPDKGVLEVIIAKQNNGPQGVVKLKFEEFCTRVDNLPDGEHESH